MWVPILDLRQDKESKLFIRPHLPCGVACTDNKCNWSGTREILAEFNLNQNGQYDYIKANEMIKGRAARTPCPHCGGVVIYTHIHLSQRKRRKMNEDSTSST